MNEYMYERWHATAATQNKKRKKVELLLRSLLSIIS